jgi:hypothetical protein
MCVKVKLSLYLSNFGPEKGPLDVLLLWLVFRLPFPLVMVYSLLIRGSVRFIRYFLLSNVVQKMIL